MSDIFGEPGTDQRVTRGEGRNCRSGEKPPPSMAVDGAGLGYSIAYMRALVQAVSSHPYEPIVNKFASNDASAKL